MDDVTVISHRSGSLLVTRGLFRKTSPHATLYRCERSRRMARMFCFMDLLVWHQMTDQQR